MCKHTLISFSHIEDGLPEINPIKVVTATEEAFCSMECTDHQECKSFVYLDYTSSDNCMLSSNVDGASVSGATGTVAIYKEVIPEVPMVRRCYCLTSPIRRIVLVYYCKAVI